jgi:aquaporin Z
VYIAAQLLGATLGALPLLLWGDMGRSVVFGATAPGAGYGTFEALLGEVATTFAMISLLTIFLAYRKIRRFTPMIFPPLYSLMVWAESPLSGTSTNPARSFGPAVISGEWQGWWIYWIGPMAGTLLALLLFSFLANRIEVAKLYHFDTQHDRLFRKEKAAAAGGQ